MPETPALSPSPSPSPIPTPSRSSSPRAAASECCLACGQALAPLGAVAGGTYGWCAACGSVALLDRPSSARLAELYRDAYPRSGHYGGEGARHLRARQRVFSQVADELVRDRPPGENRQVIELGAGWGGLAAELARRQVPYRGFEPNPELAAWARERGLAVETGELATFEPGAPEGLESIVLVAVFEHLADPEAALRRFARLLPVDGRIVLQVPTAGIPRFVGRILRRFGRRDLPGFFGTLAAPWHLLLVSPAGMRRLAERTGLELVRVRPSLSGRDGGLRSLMQLTNELVARAGCALFGERWPLVQAHLFTLRKARRQPTGAC
jgi:SAM-dependent methyltransferase